MSNQKNSDNKSNKKQNTKNMKINEWPRHGIQALWALITNSHVTGFVTGKIYTGCLDTSKSIWSYSSEIIKFDDIEFMCKDFLADTDINSDISDEEAKKNTYIHMFTGMGYDKSKVEKTWNSLEKLMKQFDIPFEKAMGCMIYALKYDCGIEIPLRNICGIDVGLIEKSIPVYQKEIVKCFGMALAVGLVYLLADSLSKEWE